jgi:hypothetical protein
MLAELNEYVLVEPISQMRMHKAGRDFSHEAHDGYHLPLKVRLRGSEDVEILTLVVPYTCFDETASFFRGLGPTPLEDSESKAKEDES